MFLEEKTVPESTHKSITQIIEFTSTSPHSEVRKLSILCLSLYALSHPQEYLELANIPIVSGPVGSLQQIVITTTNMIHPKLINRYFRNCLAVKSEPFLGLLEACSQKYISFTDMKLRNHQVKQLSRKQIRDLLEKEDFDALPDPRFAAVWVLFASPKPLNKESQSTGIGSGKDNLTPSTTGVFSPIEKPRLVVNRGSRTEVNQQRRPSLSFRVRSPLPTNRIHTSVDVSKASENHTPTARKERTSREVRKRTYFTHSLQPTEEKAKGLFITSRKSKRERANFPIL